MELTHPPLHRMRPKAGAGPGDTKQYAPALAQKNRSNIPAKAVIPDHLLPPASYQGKRQTCVAHAISRSLEAQAIFRGKPIALDADQWHCCIMGLPASFPLPTVEDAVSSPSWLSVPLRTNPPFNPGLACPPNPVATWPFAGLMKLKHGAQLAARIAAGRTVIAVISVSEAFYYHQGNGIYAERGIRKGDHCVLVTGYSKGIWQIQHSGGPKWGVHGRGWIDAVSCGLMDGLRMGYEVLPFR